MEREKKKKKMKERETFIKIYLYLNTVKTKTNKEIFFNKQATRTTKSWNYFENDSEQIRCLHSNA